MDIDVAEGGRLAILGPNGAGKTTLLRMLATLHRPDAGSLEVAGHALPERADRARAVVGYLGHDPLVYLDLTAWQNLALFADLYLLPDPARRVEECLDRVGLLARAYEPARTFSRGMTQRLGIARVMLHAPPLLLLDEPAAGLDAQGAGLLESVIADAGTVVMVTHDVDRAIAVADQVMVLRAGRVRRRVETAGLDAGAFRAEYAADRP